MDKVVKAGIAVFVLNEKDELLLGKRCGSLASGMYALPGGRPEFGEDPLATAQREVLEETGLHVWGLEQLGWVNNYFPDEDEHWITLFYVARNIRGNPQNLEPDKNEGWKWYDQGNLPKPLWEGLEKVLRKHFQKIFWQSNKSRKKNY